MLIAEKLLVTLLVVSLFLFVWRLESGWRIIFSPFLLAMYFELTRVFPAFILADYYVPVRDGYALWMALLAYVALLAGFVLFYCAPTARPARTLNFAHSRVPMEVRGFDTAGALALAVILAGLGLFYFGGLPSVVKSVFTLITAGGDAALAGLVADQRLALTKGAYFGGEYRGQGLITALQEIGWALLCTFALLRHLKMKNHVSLAWLGLALVGAWVFVAGSGTRAPLLNIMICMFAAYSWRHPLRIRTVLLAVAGACTIAILMGIYSAKMFFLLVNSPSLSNFLGAALLEIAERVFIGNGINDVYTIEFVRSGELASEFGATHVRDFVSAIPGVRYGQPLAYQLYLLVDPEPGKTTFRSATYLADVFLDFRAPGLLVVFAMIGALFAFTQRIVFQLRANAWTMSVGVVATYYVMNILRGGPVALISSMVVLGVLWLLHAGLAGMFRLLPRSSSDPVEPINPQFMTHV